MRSAILKWVQCGGNLIVHHVGKTSKDRETLERLLELNENAAAGSARSWTESGEGNTRRGLLRLTPAHAGTWSALIPKNFPTSVERLNHGS